MILGVCTYNYTFKKCSCRKDKNKKKFSEALGWSKKSFVGRFEKDSFESVFFKSLEIESVVVNVHPLYLPMLF